MGVWCVALFLLFSFSLSILVHFPRLFPCLVDSFFLAADGADAGAGRAASASSAVSPSKGKAKPRYHQTPLPCESRVEGERANRGSRRIGTAGGGGGGAFWFLLVALHSLGRARTRQSVYADDPR